MTEEQSKLLAVFEARVRQLMFLCDTQKQEIAGLKQVLSENKIELQQAKELADESNTKYNNLMMARIISVKEGEVKGASMRLSKLVREVDKCIALLNE